MSDGYLFSSVGNCYENTAVSDKKKDLVKNSQKTKLLKVLVLILSIVLVLEAIIYVVVMPCFSTVKISFTGAKTLTNKDLYAQSAEFLNKSWFEFDTVQLASSLTGNAMIESASVEKRFPDQVFVKITERVPVAATLATLNGKTVPVQIDKNGVLFSINHGIPSGKIPLVTGLAFDSPKDGMWLHPKLRSLMGQIAEIQKTAPEYFSAISEIRVLPKEYGDYELVLYPIHSRVRVLTDRTLNVESLQYMMVVLDVVASLDNNVQEVDLRYGSVSYKAN